MNDIAFTNEVINRSARELGRTPKEMEYLYKFCVDWIHKQTEATDCCSFKLPFLGTMYIKNKYVQEVISECEAKLERNPEDKASKKRKIAYQYKKDILDNYLKETGRPNSSSHHHKMENILKRSFNYGKKIEEMQDEQNRVYMILNEKME